MKSFESFQDRPNAEALEAQAIKYAVEAITAAEKTDPGKFDKLLNWSSPESKEKMSHALFEFISPEILKAYGAEADSEQAKRILAEFQNKELLLKALAEYQKS